jgi:hypothetical protein
MKKTASILIVLGSGLAAYGLSGWEADTQSSFRPGPDWTLSAGWTLDNQLEITFGIMSLAFGAILRKDSN